MTISRGQMERQLRRGGGIMDVVPREPAIFGGIKKAVKKVGKTVKKIAKSPIGKAAIAYGLTAGLGSLGAGKGLGSLGKLSTYAPSTVASNLGAALFGTGAVSDTAMKSGTEGLLKKLGLTQGFGIKELAPGFMKSTAAKGLALAGLSKFLTSQYGMTEEEAADVTNDPDQLKMYLRRYYTNLNPNAGSEEIEEFVRVNSAEGGRIGFAEGPVLPPDPTQPVNPFGPKPGDFGIEEDIPIKMASNLENEKLLEALFEKYLDMGMSPIEAEKAAYAEFERMTKREEKFFNPQDRGLAAIGGRMGFDEGTPKNPGDMAEDLANMAMRDEKVTVVIGPDGKLMMVTEDQLKEMIGKDMSPDQRGILNIDREQVLEGIVPRSNKALGDSASMNAMQAAGVEGLPIRQNPKGVKELDLRETGGFIPPVGIKEKEDDIPAMLSNNEFVFTADAVRGMGDGNVNLGAQRMYDMMKNLEAGGRV